MGRYRLGRNVKKSKYGNTKLSVDGKKFDSKGEYQRWCELQHLERSGAIRSLHFKPTYNINVNGHHICAYIADYDYLEGADVVVEDYKGVRTAVYRLKKKLMLAVHGIEIRESGKVKRRRK